MSVLLAAALSVSSATLPSCSWDRPGAFPFSGDVVAAVDRYTDIPAPVRAALKRRMEQRQYDEIAVIGRDSITGKARYSPEIRDMHFATGTVCRTVTRSRWAAKAEERGLVYCEAEHCLIVPTVCRNVSRVTRLQKAPAAAAAPAETFVAQSGGGGGGGPGGPATDAGGGDPVATLALAPGQAAAGAPLQPGELQFEAPAAGPSFVAQADPAGLGSLPLSGGGGSFGPGMPFLGGSGAGFTGGGVVTPSLVSSPAADSFVAGVVAPPSGGGSNPGGTPGGNGTGTPTGPIAGPITTGPDTGPGTGTTTPTVPFDLPKELPLPPLDTLLPVPEPGSLALMVLGLAGVAAAARRRQRVPPPPQAAR